MTILSAEQLRRRLLPEEGMDDRRVLYVTPVLDLDEQLRRSTSGLDIRLGTEFIITRRTQFTDLSPFDLERKIEELRKLAVYQERIHVEFGSPIVLHPGQFLIGSTLEYFRFPLDLGGYVTGRSSWGRLGLVIAMATFVHPGYTGVLTLELENLGDVPICLVAGVRVGQVIFHTVEGNEEARFEHVYRGKYVAASGPAYSRIYDDRERERLGKARKLHAEAGRYLRLPT